MYPSQYNHNNSVGLLCNTELCTCLFILENSSDSEAEADSNDEPLSNLVIDGPSTSHVVAKKDKTKYTWKKRPPTHDSPDIPTPLMYFRRFISDDMLEMLAYQTNLYSVPKTTVTLYTTKKEVEQVIGMFFHMGLVRMSAIRQYWEIYTAYNPVCSVMSRNRFQLFSLDYLLTTIWMLLMLARRQTSSGKSALGYLVFRPIA